MSLFISYSLVIISTFLIFCTFYLILFLDIENITNHNLNNNIRMYRGKYKMTQEDLSIRLGVSRQTINSIENNKYFPSLEFWNI